MFIERAKSINKNSIKIENFFKYVNPEPNTGCWLWSGYTMKKGYGHFSIGTKSYLAHRISYCLFKDNPDGYEICHKCDNPYCVNPDHLFKGTHKDNVTDMWAKNRQKGQFKRVQFCKRGHEKTEDNIYIYKNRHHCIKCRVIGNQLRQNKIKETKNVRN